MTDLKSVKYELEQEMERQGYTFSSFSKTSGINRGVLSSTIGKNANKSISVNQLSQMSQALHKPEDWLYELFITELLNESGTISWRRIKPLLGNCVRLQRQDFIHFILNSLTEKASYIEQIFEFAEELTENDQAISSSIFYEHIIKYERNVHTERLAVSHYRLFRLNLGVHLEQNLKAALRFAPFRNALPIHLHLDALVYLINVAYTRQDWSLMQNFSKELQKIAKLAYVQEVQKLKSMITFQPLKTERALVVYYGKGYLLEFVALEHKGNYELAEQLISQFEDLDWFEIRDSRAEQEIEDFKVFAICNRYNIKLLQGNHAVMTDYLNFLESVPQEKYSSITMILKSANLHNWDIDDILENCEHILYPENILYYVETMTNNYYSDIGISRYINIYYELALYYFERNSSNKHLDRILLALQNNIQEYHRNRLMDCVDLFKKLSCFIKTT